MWHFAGEIIDEFTDLKSPVLAQWAGFGVCGYRLDRRISKELLRDYGKVVDPAEICSRDLEDVRPGGLGVHIIKECMDSMEYCPAEGGGTVLILTKALAGCDDGAQT